MTDGIINITRFLTKQNVCNDMQNEILKYYTYDDPHPDATHILLYFKINNKLHNEYYEVIPKTPIKRIDLRNVYYFICKLYEKYFHEIECQVNKKGITIKGQLFRTKALLQILNKKKYISSKDLQINLPILANVEIKLCLKYLKIE